MEKQPQQQHIALVTGGSTGIGFETSLLLARNGFYTYATMRDPTKNNTIKEIANKENLPLEVLPLDVDNDDSVRNTINKIFDEKKKIDILVNNAGYGLFGAIEDISIQEAKKQFETNFFGAIRTIKEVLPSMREQKNGIIINITSIAGIVGIPAECIYASTKFALEGLSESISYELQPYGIKVILIEPGVINTNFVPNIKFPNKTDYNKSQRNLMNEEKSEETNFSSNDIKKKDNSSSYYSSTIDAFLSHYYPSMKNAPPPKEVAIVILEAIKKALNSSEYLFRYTVGEDAKTFAQAKKNMSDSQLHEYILNRLLR
ncbi:MAG TPA: SDR family oxidoreductase [Nitrososphaeraceae archaeon]|nr:SDR family oxidoreductase [Nitrososphaeraceae archaeon]